MKVNSIGRRYSNFKRYKEIWSILVKYGFSMIAEKMNFPKPLSVLFFEKSKRLSRQYTRAERLRMAIEELGPTFVKLGQILSTRYDILPQDIVDELSLLQDRVKEYDFEIAESIFKKEIGKDIEDVFEEFDSTPLASASIGQVYQGKLKNGEWVVLKIQRPNIKKKINNDLQILFDISKLVDEHYNKKEIIKYNDIIKEFSFFIKRELDYTYEALNCNKFEEIYKKDERVVIPKIYWEFTSKRVMCMERIQGVKLNDFDCIEKKGWDKEKLAKLGAKIFMEQIFMHSFFHGDPHPGNLMILNENKIALIDFGIVGYLDDLTLDFITNLLKAGVDKNVDKIVYSLYKMNSLSLSTNEIDLRKDLYYILNYYYNIPISKLNFSEVFSEILKIAYKHNIQIPTQLSLLIKCIMTVEGTGKKLHSNFSLSQISKDLFKEMGLKKINIRNGLRCLVNYFLDNFDNLKSLPRTIHRILDKIEKNQAKIIIKHEGFERLRKEIINMTNRISLSLVISSLIVGSSIAIHSSTKPHLFGLSAIGIIGYTVSGMLGLVLVVSTLINLKKK